MQACTRSRHTPTTIVPDDRRLARKPRQKLEGRRKKVVKKSAVAPVPSVHSSSMPKIWKDACRGCMAEGHEG